MREINTIASSLFDKIRSRFENVNLGDEHAKACTDPEKARFFNFDYINRDGKNFGNVTISLIDEDSVKVYFGQNITEEMDDDQSDEWYKFLKAVRKFAMKNMLEFDVRDISKSSLNLRDIKQQSADDSTYDVDDLSKAVTESKLYGNTHKSFANHGTAKLIINHRSRIDDSVHGARSRQIESMFVETERGERFLLPENNLHYGHAMAEHIGHGGKLEDEIGNSITGMCKEMKSMAQFVRNVKLREFDDEETTSMAGSAVRRYGELKSRLKEMRGPRGYQRYVELYEPTDDTQDDADIDALRERFVRKVWNDKFDEALPYVHKAHKMYQDSVMAEEFEQWMESITEESSDENSVGLDKLIQTPITTGVDGFDAIRNLTGCGVKLTDDMRDSIFALAQSQGPDADVRFILKAWASQNKPELVQKIDQAMNVAQQAQTNVVPQVSQAPAPSPTGQTGVEQQTNANAPMGETADPLNFLKSLAGLR
jgi:hypothetical protein